MSILFKYILFAIVATIANLGAQEATLRLFGEAGMLYPSIAVGTLVGLVVKYVLDKQWIFYCKAESAAHDGKMFVLYSCMGVLTTAIFWGFELGAEYAFNDKTLRYVGGALGLAIGYFVKYNLDKRFVFRTNQ